MESVDLLLNFILIRTYCKLYESIVFIHLQTGNYFTEINRENLTDLDPSEDIGPSYCRSPFSGQSPAVLLSSFSYTVDYCLFCEPIQLFSTYNKDDLESVSCRYK